MIREVSADAITFVTVLGIHSCIKDGNYTSTEMSIVFIICVNKLLLDYSLCSCQSPTSQRHLPSPRRPPTASAGIDTVGVGKGTDKLYRSRLIL